MSLSWQEHFVVLTLTGELDLAEAPALRAEVDQIISASPPLIACDLRQTSFIDVAGSAPLRTLCRQASAAGSVVALVQPPPRVARTLIVLGLGSHIMPLDEVMALESRHGCRRAAHDSRAGRQR